MTVSTLSHTSLPISVQSRPQAFQPQRPTCLCVTPRETPEHTMEKEDKLTHFVCITKPLSAPFFKRPCLSTSKHTHKVVLNLFSVLRQSLRSKTCDYKVRLLPSPNYGILSL